MKSLFTEKVDSKDIRMLEKKVEQCAPWESVRNVYKELSFYLKKDDFELNKADNQSQIKKMHQMIDTLIPKQEAMREIASLRAMIYSDLEKYSRIRDVQNDKLEYGKMFQKVQETQNDFKRSFAKIENDIVNLRRAMDKKADEDELKDTQKSLNQYAEKDDLQILQRKVIPKIEEFEQKLISFTAQAETHDEIIRRYDEVISEKASKWNIQEILTEMNNNFTKLKQFNNCEEKIWQLQKDIESMAHDSEEKFDTLNKQIGKEIVLAVRKVQKQSGFKNSGFSSGNGGGYDFDEIRKILNLKANTSELNQLMELKSNKIDTESLMNSQQILSRQIKHLLVLFMESLKLSINEVMDTKMTQDNKKKFILNQLKALAKWILRFEPGQQNSTNSNSDGFENDFMLGEESRALQDFTDQILGEQIYQPLQSQQKLPMSFQNINNKKSRDRYNKSLNNQSTILSQISEHKNQLFQNRRISNQMNQVNQSMNRSIIGTTCSDITHRTNESISAQYQIGQDTDKYLLNANKEIDMNKQKKYSLAVNRYTQKLESLHINSNITHTSGLMSANASPRNERQKLQLRYKLRNKGLESSPKQYKPEILLDTIEGRHIQMNIDRSNASTQVNPQSIGTLNKVNKQTGNDLPGL